jgi:hypothetical protein
MITIYKVYFADFLRKITYLSLMLSLLRDLIQSYYHGRKRNLIMYLRFAFYAFSSKLGKR